MLEGGLDGPFAMVLQGGRKGIEAERLGEGYRTCGCNGDEGEEALLADLCKAMVGADGLKEALERSIGKETTERFGVALCGGGIVVNGVLVHLGTPGEIRVVEEARKVIDGWTTTHALEVNEIGTCFMPKDVGALEVSVHEHVGFFGDDINELLKFGLNVRREGGYMGLVEVMFPLE